MATTNLTRFFIHALICSFIFLAIRSDLSILISIFDSGYILVYHNNYLRNQLICIMNKKATKIYKKIKNEPKLADVLNAVNDGFTVMEGRFQDVDRQFQGIGKQFQAVDRRFDEMQSEMDRRFREVFTVLDGHTKKLEGLEQEKYFTFHAVQRLERDIEKVKKILHLSS